MSLTIRALIYNPPRQNLFTLMGATVFQRELVFCLFIHTGIEPDWDENLSRYLVKCVDSGKITKEELTELAEEMVSFVCPF